MTAALVTEIAMTFMFLIIILGAAHSGVPKGFAGIAIGLGLTLIHLISIPLTNTFRESCEERQPGLVRW